MPKMQPGSSVLVTTSVQGFQPTGGLLAYSSTKGAIRTFVHAFSELAMKNGIRANGAAPGPVLDAADPLHHAVRESQRLR